MTRAPATTIGLRLDPSAEAPLFEQIVQQLAERVRSGAFPPGFRLPPTRDLARALGVHRNTVVRAFEELGATGVVTSQVGSGTYVARPQPAAPAAAPAPAALPADAPRLPWESLLSRGVKADALRRADRLARGAPPVTAGREPIDLQRLQPAHDLLPVASFRRALDHVLRVHRGRVLGYGPREGLPRLRRAIADHLAAGGVPTRAEDVLVTTGSQQGIDLVTRALVDPGDTFLVDAATYPGALHLLAAAGAQALPVPSDAEGPDLAFLRRLPRGRTKGLYLMPGCKNPTGERISTARREALVVWSRQAGVPLIEDDYGADLVLDPDAPALPPLRVLDPDVLHLGTFSKRLIPALRIGYVVCPPGLVERLAPLKHAVDLGASLLLQHALAEFLERGYLRAHLRTVLPEYRRRVAALEDALSRHAPDDVTWRRPVQGLALWVALPPALDPETVYQEARRQGVLVGPGSLHAAGPSGAHGLRLTFCAEPPERIAEGVRRLAAAIEAVRPRPVVVARGAKRPRRAREVESPALGV